MTTRLCAAGLVCLLLGVPLTVRGADDKATDSKKSSVPAATTDDSATEKEPRVEDLRVKGRLPSGWGRLGISDAQRQAIYQIQGTYAAKIAALQKQLEDL